MALSIKQAKLLNARLPRITILDGAISSGKTFIGNNKSVNHLIHNYKGEGLVFFIGKTLDTLERNILTPLENQYGRGYFSYSKGAKKAILCGIPIELEGCNDIRAEAKIRGTTAEFIYGDELTLWNKSFLTRCMGSLRTPNAKFLGTTNPDTPQNFVMKDFIKRKKELDMFHLKFMMEDNPTLTDEYKRQVKLEYTGVLHDRFIKGLWVAAEGVIYQMFADNPSNYIINELKEPLCHVNIGVDFGGNSSNSFFIATGFTKGYKKVIVLEEESRPAATENPETLQKAYVSFVKKIKKKFDMTYFTYADSAEQILIRGLKVESNRENVNVQIVNAIKGEITERIRLVSSLFGQNRLFIMGQCKHIQEALKAAVWDSRSIEKDKRLDDGSYNMDAIDSFEYTLEPVAKKLQLLR